MWVISSAKGIEELLNEDGSANTEDGNDSRSAYEKWSSYIPTYEENLARKETENRYRENFPSVRTMPSFAVEDDTEAEEYPVAEKQFPGTERFVELDRYARMSPEQAEMSMEILSDYLTRPASNDLEKARLLFTWIATHVAYDDDGFNTGNYSDTSPESVFKNRISVCHGYSELFRALCKLAGLEAETIIGYTKGIGYRTGSTFNDTNHAWNGVKIDGEWKLFDVTWAAGYGKGVNGRLVTVMEFENYWFNTSPYEFIFSHLPEEAQWQLLPFTVSKEQFENMSYVSNSFFEMGFSGEAYLDRAMNDVNFEFPQSFRIDGSVIAVSLPGCNKVSAGKPFRVILRSSKASDIAVTNNGEWVHLKRTDDDFSAVIRPLPGELDVNIKNPGDGTYKTLLSYIVE